MQNDNIKRNFHSNNIPFEFEIIPINLVERDFQLEDKEICIGVSNFWFEILRFCLPMTSLQLPYKLY